MGKMTISERKKYLRERGIIPVSKQQGVAAPKTGSSAIRPRSTRAQPNPTFRLVIGVVYLVMSPFLFFPQLAQVLSHKAKVPLTPMNLIITLGLPLVLFAFGAWSLYRGLAERRSAAAAAEKRQ